MTYYIFQKNTVADVLVKFGAFSFWFGRKLGVQLDCCLRLPRLQKTHVQKTGVHVVKGEETMDHLEDLRIELHAHDRRYLGTAKILRLFHSRKLETQSNAELTGPDNCI